MSPSSTPLSPYNLESFSNVALDSSSVKGLITLKESCKFVQLNFNFLATCVVIVHARGGWVPSHSIPQSERDENPLAQRDRWEELPENAITITTGKMEGSEKEPR